MPKFRNPAEVYDEGKLLGGMTDLPKTDKKPKKKKKPTACGQGSCSADNIRDYK